MTETVQLESDLVDSFLYCSPGNPEGDWDYADTIEGDDRRWYRKDMLVLKRLSDETYWGVYYDHGLTEYQENEYPWAGKEFATLFRVYPKVVSTVTYSTKP